MRSRMGQSSDSYRAQVAGAQSVRQEYFSLQRPRILRVRRACLLLAPLVDREADGRPSSAGPQGERRRAGPRDAVPPVALRVPFRGAPRHRRPHGVARLGRRRCVQLGSARLEVGARLSLTPSPPRCRRSGRQGRRRLDRHSRGLQDVHAAVLAQLADVGPARTSARRSGRRGLCASSSSSSSCSSPLPLTRPLPHSPIVRLCRPYRKAAPSSRSRRPPRQPHRLGRRSASTSASRWRVTTSTYRASSRSASRRSRRTGSTRWASTA